MARSAVWLKQFNTQRWVMSHCYSFSVTSSNIHWCVLLFLSSALAPARHLHIKGAFVKHEPAAKQCLHSGLHFKSWKEKHSSGCSRSFPWIHFSPLFLSTGGHVYSSLCGCEVTGAGQYRESSSTWCGVQRLRKAWRGEKMYDHSDSDTYRVVDEACHML